MRSRSPINEHFGAYFVTVIIGVCLTSAPLTLAAIPGGVSGGLTNLDQPRGASSPYGNSGIYLARAERRQASGDINGALADYAVAISMAPKSADARYSRACLYYAIDRFAEAVADLDVAVREEPRSLDARLLRGEAHGEMGHYQSARADYDEVIRVAPNSADGHLLIAGAYCEKANYTEAASHYARAKKMSPRNTEVLRIVAWFRGTCPGGSFRNGKEAVQDGTRACELTKWRDGECLDALAAAYAEVGDYKQAITYETQALSLVPVPPNSVKHWQKHLQCFRAHKPFRDNPKLR